MGCVHGVPVGSRGRVSVNHPWVPMGCPWGVVKISLGVYWVSVGSARAAHESPVSVGRVSMGVHGRPWDARGQLI